MEGRFSLNYESNIILYGAASIGKIMHEQFSKHGYKVIGFIDKRALEINEFRGLPVWAIDNVPSYIKEDIATVVFVSVKNVFEHDKIVNELLNYSFQKIIFKPYASLFGNASDEECEIEKAYENFSLTGECNSVDNIPMSAKKVKVYSKDYGLIKDDLEEVIAYIPVDYIFTNDYKDAYMKKWGNVNLLAFFTHMQFFQYFQGVPKMDYNLYIEEYCVYTGLMQKDIKITQAWKDNVFRNRMQIYKEMELSLQLDSDFFIHNAPTAEWNSKGWFNLTSGKHRSTFLASKGQYLIPLRVKKRDYIEFLNLNIFNELQKMCEERNADIEYFNLPHPYVYRCGTSSVVCQYSIIRTVVMYLAVCLYKKYGCVDFSNIYLNTVISDEYLHVILYLIRMGCVGKFEILESEPYRSICKLQHIEIENKKFDCDDVEQLDFIDLDYLNAQIIDIRYLKGEMALFISREELNYYNEEIDSIYDRMETFGVSDNGRTRNCYLCRKK